MNLNAFHPTPSDFIRQKSYGMTHGTIFHPTCRIRHFVGSCVTGIISLSPAVVRSQYCLLIEEALMTTCYSAATLEHHDVGKRNDIPSLHIIQTQGGPLKVLSDNAYAQRTRTDFLS